MRRVYLHPLFLRIWHWMNAVIVIQLIVTGLYLRLHGMAAIRPRDPALLWHKYLGLAMIVTVVCWMVFNMANPNQRRHYRIGCKDMKGIVSQGRYYLFSIFKGAANPFQASVDQKYNPLQKISYDAVMFIFLPLQTLTGLCFMDIPILRPWLLSGHWIGMLATAHVFFAYSLVLFLIVHLYMATLGETLFSHIRAMITGYGD